MIKKLLKYDLTYVYKIISIYYILSIIFALLTRIFWNLDTTLFNILGSICSGVTITLMINVLINTLIRNWARFNINFYKDESYLTHTLPVSKTEHYFSKFITALITMITSTLMIVLTLFIAYYSKENFNILKEMLFGITSIYDTSIRAFITGIVIVFFLEMFLMLVIIYTGIILGNKKNNNKTLWTVIYSIIIYFASQSILLLFSLIYGLFNKNILKLFTSNTVPDVGILKTFLIFAIIIYTIFIIVYTIVNLKIFKSGVNVD